MNSSARNAALRKHFAVVIHRVRRVLTIGLLIFVITAFLSLPR